MSTSEGAPKRRSLFGELTRTENGFSVKYPDDYEVKLMKERTDWERFNEQVHDKLELQQQGRKLLNSLLTKNDLNRIDDKYRKFILDSLNFDCFKQTTEEFLIKQLILADMKQSCQTSNDGARRKIQSTLPF